MLLFRIEIEQRSAFLTEPTAGALMGHLAWAYRYLHGPEALETLLSAYRTADEAGTEPPLICSAALPVGLLPRPQFEHLSPGERDGLALARYGSDLAAAHLRLDQELSAVRGQRWVERQVLVDVIDRLSAVSLFRSCLAATSKDKPELNSGPVLEDKARKTGKQRLATRVRTQPGMSRLTGGVQSGMLYDSDELVYLPGQQLEIWVRIAEPYADEAWMERWRTCMRLLQAQGFGARKSVGMGAFSLNANLTPVDEDALPQAKHANGFLSLAGWTPRANDPAALVYALNTRHGRLGGLYGSSDDVWKYPASELLPGAVGRLADGEALRPAYGGLVEHVHRTRPEIVNFGYAFPIGVRIG